MTISKAVPKPLLPITPIKSIADYWNSRYQL